MNPSADDLERRVRRLEEGLAQLQALERVVVSANGEPPHAITMMAERPASAGGFLQEAGRRVFGSDSDVSPTAGQAEVFVPLRPASSRSLPFEIWAEARVIVRMYLDPRYRISWIGRVAPLVLLGLILTSGLWPLSYIPFLGTWFMKVLDLVLAFVLFKVVGNETRKYRKISPDLPPALRL